jgi:hypothetical protein
VTLPTYAITSKQVIASPRGGYLGKGCLQEPACTWLHPVRTSHMRCLSQLFPGLSAHTRLITKVCSLLAFWNLWYKNPGFDHKYLTFGIYNLNGKKCFRNNYNMWPLQHSNCTYTSLLGKQKPSHMQLFKLKTTCFQVVKQYNLHASFKQFNESRSLPCCYSVMSQMNILLAFPRSDTPITRNSGHARTS